MSKNFFNHTIKDQFIEYYMKTRKIKKTSLVSLFRKIATFEIEAKIDCCQFSLQQVINMYLAFEAKSVDVLLSYNTILKAYCAWMRENISPTNISAYDEITQGMLSPLVSVKLLTRQDVIDIEESLYNWTDKAIVECLWEGVAGNSMSDLVSITDDMIDQDNRTLCFSSGKVIPLSDRLLFLLNHALDETHYKCYGSSQRTKRLTGSRCLYKERDNAHAPASEDKYFRWVYRKIQIYRDFVGIKKFTMKNISTSGMYYYICEGMRQTGLDMKSYLLTDEGKTLLDKYRSDSEYRIDNVIHRFSQFIQREVQA